MSLYFVPFNHQPAATGQTTGTYTVPSGKYARATVKYSVSAGATAASLTNANVAVIRALNINPSSVGGEVEFWLKAGDALTATESLPTNNLSLTSTGAGEYWDAETGNATITFTVNGNDSGKVRASCAASVGVNMSGATTFTYATFEGSTVFSIFYEEYNVIA